MPDNDKVLLVLTSHDRLGDTGKPTGAYLAEVAHPYDVFVRAGLAVEFASPRGGRPPLDGVENADAVGRAFLDDRAIQARLDHTRRLDELDPADYAAIVFAGGHGTMWDFPRNEPLAALAAAIYERGGVVAAVCHGPAALVDVRLSDGTYLVAGRRVAAFTNDEERAVKLEEVVPFMLADELTRRGAVHIPAPNWQPHVVVDGRLVTGQNPASAAPLAEHVVGLLTARPAS